MANTAQEAMKSWSGLRVLTALMNGELPPPGVAAITQQHLIEVAHGRVVWQASPPDNFINPAGDVHGGWAMTVLDSALGCAVHSALAPGVGYTTMEAKINLTRAPIVGHTYRVEGVLLSLGRRSATSEAKMYDAAGKLTAFATTTCMVFQPDQ